MTALYFHTIAHLSHQWRESFGPFGWWVWAQWPKGGLGYGVVHGHLVSWFHR